MTHGESWHTRNIPPLGTRVHDVCDPKHSGRLTAIVNSVTAVVVFDNGWRAHLPVHVIRKSVDE